jgi:hypothetical protein
MPTLPSAEQIRMTEAKARPLPIEPWVAAGFSRLWQTMKQNIRQSIDADSSRTPMRGSADTQAQPHTDQSTPASARNRS